MDTATIINIVAQFVVAGVAIWAVLASLHTSKTQTKKSEEQISRQIEENRRLTTEERKYQSRPIITPKGEVSHTTPPLSVENLYTSEQRINWGWQHEIRIAMDNLGRGPAFNVHCLLYGNEPACQNQFASWNNGPIGAESTMTIELTHSSELCLFHKDSLDGEHPLYDQSLDAPSNPGLDRIACLTITYHDLFGTKYMSIFNYTLEHRWVCMVIDKIPLVKENAPFDLKELNNQRKQQTPKYSAPPIPRRGN